MCDQHLHVIDSNHSHSIPEASEACATTSQQDVAVEGSMHVWMTALHALYDRFSDTGLVDSWSNVRGEILAGTASPSFLGLKRISGMEIRSLFSLNICILALSSALREALSSYSE